MKMNYWLLCGAFLAANVSAQQAANTPPPAATGAARTSPGAGQSPRTTPLKPGPAVVVANHVNVRGQPRLMGEILTRLGRGHKVTVLEEIQLQNSGPEEPSAWAKILLPQDSKVWVSGLFIDPTDKKVTATRLNLRGGPGENYSILGRIERGYQVTELEVKEDWIQIEPPEGAYAFMAAQYLSQEEGAALEMAASTPATPPTHEPAPSTPVTIPTPGEKPLAATPPEPAPEMIPVNEPPPALTPVVEASPIAKETTDAAVPRSETPAPAAPSTTIAPATNTVTLAPIPSGDSQPAPEEPPAPRIVSREGVVRGSVSVQAPSHFELYSPESKRIINYLYNNSPDLDLSRYKGLRIIVTGREGLDERWRNTPLLTIQKIQVLE